MNIAFVTKYDERQEKIAEITTPGRVAYCARHGYTYIRDTLPFDSSRNGMWMKVLTLIRTLQNDAYRDIDWFFWSDIDVLIMNPDIRLESYIPGDIGPACLIMSLFYYYDTQVHFTHLRSDTPVMVEGRIPYWGSIHSGNFFVRNCTESLELLTRIYNDARFREYRPFAEHITGDEIGFTCYYYGYPEYRQYFRLYPGETFFIVPEEGGLNYNVNVKFFADGDFLLHAACLPPERKVEILSSYAPRAR